mgnify:CR=1 FL=1
MMGLATELEDPAPALRQVEPLERDRAVLLQEVQRLEDENAPAMALARVTEADLRRALQTAAAYVAALDRERLKDLLQQLIERIELDPATWERVVRYRVGLAERNRLASPTGFEPVSPP